MTSGGAWTRRPGMLGLAVVLIGCSAAGQAARPPEIRYGEALCARCGMIISEEEFASARVLATGEAELYDDIGCLLLATSGAGGRLWVHGAPTGAWIDARKAFYVQQSTQRTPMGFGMVAFAQAAEAAARAGGSGGRVLRLDEAVQWFTQGGGA